jgi:hypothetical protein
MVVRGGDVDAFIQEAREEKPACLGVRIETWG